MKAESGEKAHLDPEQSPSPVPIPPSAFILPPSDAPSWETVAPLIARWRLSIVPHHDGTWDVVAFPTRRYPPQDARRVWFADLLQAIADVAARCEADAAGEGEACP